MSDDRDQSRLTLRRWSQRKHEASRAAREAKSGRPDPPPQPARVDGDAPPAPTVAVPAVAAAATAPPAGAAPPATEPALPPVESLHFDSDFSVFMQPKVGEDLKRQALKKLFRDPRFNVMDGLDVYIDDYTIPSPLEPELARELVQARYIFDPPKTRVNAQGWVEDVPPETLAEAPDAAAPAEERAQPGEAAVGGGSAAVPEAFASAATADDASAAQPGAGATTRRTEDDEPSSASGSPTESA